VLSKVERDVEAVAALEDDLRRRMYVSVRRLGRPASRDEVAAAVGVSRKLAAFHLDKLVERGLLVASYARPEGRSGRGAGRSAKYYAPSGREFDVTIPERRYDVMGSILLGAIERQEPGEPTAEAARRVAHETGDGIGREERTRRKLTRPGPERTMHAASEILATCGYEPYASDGTVRLRSCPFHELAQKNRDIVCGLNRELIDGIVRGLGNETVDVSLAPTPGECCVELRAPSGTASPTASRSRTRRY
jgi:predicted ArsR family transcriptional regulator